MKWLTGLLGIWTIVIPFLRMGHSGDFWANLLTGALLAIFGFVMVRETPGRGWITGLIGVWLFASAFLAPITMGTGLFWNNIILGFIVAVMDLSAPQHPTQHPSAA